MKEHDPERELAKFIKVHSIEIDNLLDSLQWIGVHAYDFGFVELADNFRAAANEVVESLRPIYPNFSLNCRLNKRP